VLIHAGRGWPSKTFPAVYWDDIVDGLLQQGVKVALIGKHIGTDQGYVGLNSNGRKGIIDLRDKLDLGMLFAAIQKSPVLITNDSAPAHIAGAFDKHLILIPTCKHLDHVLPWRNGSQTYKTAAVYNRLTCDDIDSTPTQVNGQTIDWVKGGDIMPYLPNAVDVVNRALCLL
jgi:ADP-heptose:LPS heptosyltransferase